jgi:hypothetical protein
MTRFSRASAAVILVLASLWLASSEGVLRAQSSSTPPQRQLLMINEISLKPETAPDWAELQKSEAIPTQKKAGLAWREAWASGPGGDPYLRAIVTPISSLAQYDNPNPLIKVLGEQGFAAYSAKNRKLVAGAHSTIVITRPDLGFGSRQGAPKLAILSVVNAASGRGPDFEAFLKTDIVPALKKAGVGYYSVVQVVFGDDVNKYLTLTLVNDYAEIAKGSPLERALGPEGMVKLTQKAGPLVTRLERRIIRYLPDLSYGPSTPTSH